jgi:hypothetical protein
VVVFDEVGVSDETDAICEVEWTFAVVEEARNLDEDEDLE